MPQALELRAGDGGLIGRLSGFEQDMFWVDAQFQPGPRWPEYATFFERDRQLLSDDRIDELLAHWEHAHSEGMVLLDPEVSAPITEFMVHVDTRDWSARFRY